jgi:hypothetical protein
MIKSLKRRWNRRGPAASTFAEAPVDRPWTGRGVAWRAFFAVCAPLVFEPVRQYPDFVTNFGILNMGVSGISFCDFGRIDRSAMKDDARMTAAKSTWDGHVNAQRVDLA